MKPHLLLVHSFPTNSILLHGLEEFLSDFFTVHFIDLPGFHEKSHPLSGVITLRKFSKYFEQKIAELDVDEYIVAGISFGFLVVNNAKLDKRCKAVLAIEPFLNTKCLNISFGKQKEYAAISSLLKVISFFRLENKIWESDWFNKYLQKTSDYPKERIDRIIRHIDPRTFFAVGGLLMSYKKSPTFQNLPYYLVGNFEDNTINFASVVEVFKSNVQKLYIFSVPIDHYPKDPTKEYFKSRIPSEYIQNILAQLNLN